MEDYLLITDLFDVEQTTFCADIRIAKIFDSIDNRGTNGKSDTVVV